MVNLKSLKRVPIFELGFAYNDTFIIIFRRIQDGKNLLIVMTD